MTKTEEKRFCQICGEFLPLTELHKKVISQRATGTMRGARVYKPEEILICTKHD